jgi:hypothetical protein
MEVNGWGASLSTFGANRRYILVHAPTMTEAIEDVVREWVLEKRTQISDTGIVAAAVREIEQSSVEDAAQELADAPDPLS